LPYNDSINLFDSKAAKITRKKKEDKIKKKYKIARKKRENNKYYILVSKMSRVISNESMNHWKIINRVLK